MGHEHTCKAEANNSQDAPGADRTSEKKQNRFEQGKWRREHMKVKKMLTFRISVCWWLDGKK
jgi:hypothetical protein